VGNWWEVPVNAVLAGPYDLGRLLNQALGGKSGGYIDPFSTEPYFAQPGYVQLTDPGQVAPIIDSASFVNPDPGSGNVDFQLPVLNGGTLRVVEGLVDPLVKPLKELGGWVLALGAVAVGLLWGAKR